MSATRRHFIAGLIATAVALAMPWERLLAEPTITCTDCSKSTPEKDSYQLMESRELGYEVPSTWDGTMVPATEMVQTATLCRECAQQRIGPDGPQLRVKGGAEQ